MAKKMMKVAETTTLTPGGDPVTRWVDREVEVPGEAAPQVQSYEEILKSLPKLSQVDLSSIIEQRKKGLGGYTSEESEAQRSQMAGALNRQQQMAQRQLAAKQARAGVYGGAASAQGSRLLQNLTQQRAAGEQELFVKNIAEQQRRLKEYEDLQKAQQFGNLASSLAQAQLAQAERAAQMQLQSATQTAEAQKKAAGGGGLCCFIFLEARYADGTMDSVVRRYRDEKMTERNKRGYYKLAEVLVPLMRKSKIFKFFIQTTMTSPLVAYGRYYYGESKLGVIFTPIERFWMRAFNFFGQDHEFVRENGETI